MIHDPVICRLGKKPPKRDSRDLKFARYLTPSLPPVPASADWGSKVGPDWGQMGNNEYGDCTCAAVGHAVLAFTADTGSLFKASDQQVLALYTTVTGQEGAAFSQVTGANDNGCSINDVLNEWRRNGFFGHGLGAYASIDPTNFDHLKAAIAFLGVCDIGVGLPITAKDQRIWSVTDPDLRGDSAPNSWGGHSVVVTAYDAAAKLYTVITWGAEKKCTEAWLGAYMDEAYALLATDWVSGNKPAPSGFNVAALQSDLAALTLT